MSEIAADISVDSRDSIDSQDEKLPSAMTVALVQLALACGGFGIGTGEFAIMGLLPNVAETFSVTTPQAGYVISAYALGVVVGAPVIAVLAAKMARRTLLLMLMLIFAAGNISSAMAPTFESFTLLRFVSGLPHGAYFGVAALVAASMVPVHRRARAVGRVMLGLTVATLLGTPLTTFFGQSLDWQVAFFSVGVLGLLTVALIWFYVPKDRVSEEAGFLRELGAFRRPQVWLTLGIAAVGYGGMFAMFSYIASTTTEVAMLPETAVPIMLVLFGVGMNAGNFIGSWLADKSLLGTIGGSLVYNIVVLTTFSLTAANPYMLGLSVFLVGCGFAAGPALQTRLMDVAADAQTLAAASNHSAFNIANAIGAWLGGLVIAGGYGFAATGYVGAALSFLGLFVFAASLRLERRDRGAQAV
ncbi:MFS transporter [Rhizobium leguminosarum]|uniref:MFS transporter n=1 Tax=Rhizobium ruizarguesonis TaxID=2081791 RepID=A0AB38I3T4_9HYPH|nr:MFS transporter [Rhizobium ruizarguesonis]NEJ22847.1 MFS transporter [Rhizobium leguminosarum]NKK60136.1 MFS transporter [Rhizobium leguminosarum bv. viciae]TBC15220.1 MFS transporter [Rhizobium ruizarguesonis]